MALSRKNKMFLGLGVCLVAVLFIVPAIGRIFGPIGSAIKSAFGAVNSGLKSGMQAIGLDQKTNDDVHSIVVGGIGDPWDPTFYQPYFDAGTTSIYTKVQGNDLVDQALECQTAMGGVHMDRWTGLFQSFPSQCHFSSFCYWWTKSEGTQLQTWMLDGWLGGLVASMGNSDFLTLDAIIRAKPVYKK